jgi:putative transposase
VTASASVGKIGHSRQHHLLSLPPKSPELNPVENIRQFMRDKWLSNRIFKSYDDLVDYCCDAWNKLVDQPWTIMSIGLAIGAGVLMEDNPVRVIDVFVDELDLAELGFSGIDPEATGRPAYHPSVLSQLDSIEPPARA